MQDADRGRVDSRSAARVADTGSNRSLNPQRPAPSPPTTQDLGPWKPYDPCRESAAQKGRVVNG